MTLDFQFEWFTMKHHGVVLLTIPERLSHTYGGLVKLLYWDNHKKELFCIYFSIVIHRKLTLLHVSQKTTVIYWTYFHGRRNV